MLLLGAAPALMLAGCFSMSAVTPPSGLEPAATPAAHAAAKFDRAVSTQIDSDWGEDGLFLLVHPRVNGQDLGWFILDSGASGCTLTEDAARRASLRVVGSTRIQGAIPTTVYLSESLALGPLTLTGLHFTGLNMRNTSMAFGRDVVGILGRNVFSSAIVELDGPARVIRLHDPAAAPSTSGQAVWIDLDRGLPLVTCTFAFGATGPFIVDTGADASVHFYEHAVARHALLEHAGTKISGATTQITLGSMRRVDEGEISQFSIGDASFGATVATFARPGDGTSEAQPHVDGLVGMGLMRLHHLWFDESGRRLVVETAPRNPAASGSLSSPAAR